MDQHGQGLPPQSSYCHPYIVRFAFPVTQLIICVHGPDTWGLALYGTLLSWGAGLLQ